MQRYCLLLLLSFFSNSMLAQDEIPSYEGPFHKDRFITGLSGSIRSAALSDNPTSPDRQFLEGYQLGTNSGYFFIDRLATGMSFKVSREVNESVVRIESESMQIGPWIRYYTSLDPRGSVYPEISLQYINYLDNTQIDSAIPEVSILRASGFGIEAGVGFTYVVSDNIGFDIGISYVGGFLNGRSSTTSMPEVVNDNFFLGQLDFRFGFIAIVDEFFF